MQNHANFEDQLAMLQPLKPSEKLPIRIAEVVSVPMPAKQFASKSFGGTQFLTRLAISIVATVAFVAIIMRMTLTEPAPESNQEKVVKRSLSLSDQFVDANTGNEMGGAKVMPDLFSEIRPDPFKTIGHRVIARGKIKVIHDVNMTIEIDRFLTKEQLAVTRVTVPKTKWAWLDVCQEDDIVYLYWGEAPSVLEFAGQQVSMLIRCAETSEKQVWRFHCGRWDFFEGSLESYENKLGR